MKIIDLFFLNQNHSPLLDKWEKITSHIAHQRIIAQANFFETFDSWAIVDIFQNGGKVLKFGLKSVCVFHALQDKCALRLKPILKSHPPRHKTQKLRAVCPPLLQTQGCCSQTQLIMTYVMFFFF